MTIKELCEQAHALAVSKGWYQDGCRNVGELLALVHSEISEALEEYRSGYDLREISIDSDGKPIGFAIELADAVLRIADMCGALGIELEAAILAKHEYNKTRPYRHGNKKA